MQLRVKDMLRDHDKATGLLDTTPWRPKALAFNFQPGQVVADRYEIVRLVGKGGMGEVYEAKDLDLNERVAIKTLLPEIAALEPMVLRFKREIQLSRRIAHPNVCRIFDITRHPAGVPAAMQTLCLTMEMLAGETLLQTLERDGEMLPARALPILTQVADALEAAHRAGVVHRDLKASNVMLVPAYDGGVRAVVTDFGLARRLNNDENDHRITETGKLLGTWDYMAPELLEGHQPSPASDIYSLGILSYVVITGNHPFPESSPIDAIIRRSKEPVPAPSTLVDGLEPHWDKAILGCLEPDPARRFQRGAEFATALINWKE
jgi:serine/threonine protein kinase